VRINAVGIRLKGNASLQMALGGGMGGGAPGGRGGNFFGNGDLPADGEMPPLPEGFQPPADGAAPAPPAGFQMPADGQMPDRPAGGVFQPGAGFVQAAAGQVKIPFLIKFDEYVDGQTYQGYSHLSIRNYGVSYDEAMLAEPVTNDTVRLIGLPATQTAYTGFSFNDEDERLYVISEILDEEYLAQTFDYANGVLYKAEVGSTLSYQGEDPSSYARSFSQETRVNEADLAPLIAFMRVLDQADDAAFERELPDYLDVESFAAYLAVNNLLVNTDSLIGMNNNYYLYYDDVAGRFTLLMWDGNESMGGLGGGSSANFDLYFSGVQGMRGPGGGGGGGMGGGQNVLLERFMANATFKALYEEKLRAIYQQAFLSGALAEDVERYAALIHSVNDKRGLVDLTAYDQAVQSLLSFITLRMEYLNSTELLGQ
jgi:spore coat protein CotH